MEKRYRDLNTYLRGIYGCRVQKITLDAGMSCPNRDGTVAHGGCIYCNARGSGTGGHEKGIPIIRQIEEGKNRLARRYKAKKFIAYFQSFSNTYAPCETLRVLYDQALSVEDVIGLSIGTRPDCVSESILDLLEGYARSNMIWVEYGLQSANDETLTAINRGHDAACFEDAVTATRGRGIRICAHVILGLPGETRDEMMKTAEFISHLGVDGVKIHLLYVVRDTGMHKLYQNSGFKCLKQGQYVELVCDFLERLPPEMIIQRLTGDPHRDELVAPLWSMRKGETLEMIHQTLKMRNSRQGSRWGGMA